jgi:hypothetical protein
VAGPELRRHKAASLRTDALARGAAQRTVWASVDEQLSRHLVASPTAANSDGFAAREPEIRDLSKRFELEPGQNGVLVSIAGQGWCLDAVSRPAVFERIYPKLLAGYVYDAFDPAGEVTSPEVVLEQLARCKKRQTPSVALGEDVRFEGKDVIGSGLVLEGELVQLSAYGDGLSR